MPLPYHVFFTVNFPSEKFDAAGITVIKVPIAANPVAKTLIAIVS
ncbi:hypothetical protein SDC9_109358 [bioreactor metagenome]|uniref:Uncharacterized protein n=1 Tax=bioreactor metagenome TaxID=1076179 RepID=A0A645BBL1_9ZZZZ